MNATIRFTLFIFLFYLSFFSTAQTTYEILYLGNYKDSLRMDRTKNWYCYTAEKNGSKFVGDTLFRIKEDGTLELSNSCYGNEVRRTKLDIDRDVLQLKVDTTYDLQLSEAYTNKKVYLLVGTRDTLKEGVYKDLNLNIPYSLPIGYQEQVYQQGFRDASPYVNLYITGSAWLANKSTMTKKQTIEVGCDFDYYAYYKCVGFGKKEFTKRESFVQSLNPMIDGYFAQKGKYNKKRGYYYIHLVFAGYIDDDALVDFVFTIDGTEFLFLSYAHDLDKKSIYHLHAAWKDTRLPLEF